jgi:outer membrane protein
MNTLRHVFLISILIHSQRVWSAEKILTWDDCVQTVTQNNEELKSSEKSLQAYTYLVNGAYSTFLPQVTGSLNYSYGKATTTQADPDTAYSATLTASDNLFNGFQDAARVEQAKSNREVAQITYQTTKAKISYDLKSAVSNLLYAQDSVGLAANIVERRELNLKTVQLRFVSGRENKGSLLLSKAYLEDARLDKLQADQSLNVAQSVLLKVLGQDDEATTFQLKGALPVAEPPSSASVDFKKLVLESPTYLQAVAQQSLSEAAVTIARANFYPSLSVSATAGDAGPTFYPAGTHQWFLGAAVTFPLFNGGRDFNASRSASENLKASELTRSSTLKGQTAQLKLTFVSFVQAVQRLKVSEFYVQASTVRERVSRQKYNNGLSTFDDWDVIENDLIKRQKDLLVSRRDRVLAEAAWEQLQGKGVLP